MLNEEYDRLKSSVENSFGKYSSTCGCSLVSDWAENVKRVPKINALFVSGIGAMFVEQFSANDTLIKDKEYIAMKMCDVIRKAPAGPESVVSVIMDGANRGSFDLIREQFP